MSSTVPSTSLGLTPKRAPGVREKRGDASAEAWPPRIFAALPPHCPRADAVPLCPTLGFKSTFSQAQPSRCGFSSGTLSTSPICCGISADTSSPFPVPTKPSARPTISDQRVPTGPVTVPSGYIAWPPREEPSPWREAWGARAPQSPSYNGVQETCDRRPR